MGNLIDGVMNKKLSRRKFLAVSAAGAATLALPGCSSNSLVGTNVDATSVNSEGRWVTGGCTYDCGGRCLNKVLVVDSIAIRQKTDDTHPDSHEFPQTRGCCRGRAQRVQVFGADKLKYPMKRKNYEIGGGKKELRGNDEWERISWDEAIDILATELKNAKEKAGNESILLPTWNNYGMNEVMNKFGGYTGMWSTNSYGGWSFASKHLGTRGSRASKNDRLDFLNTETVIMFSLNPAWSSPGITFNYYSHIKKTGAKFIFIDPFYNESVAALDAEWIPIRPGTDTALLAAVAHVLITEDDSEKNPLIDWEFLKRCSIGFDQDGMPEGADPKSNFRDYILGTHDGIPKDPEWAYEICGVEPQKIKQLAYEMRKDKKVSLLASSASARIADGDCFPHMLYTIATMTGHYGRSGHNCANAQHRSNIDAGDFLYKVGSNKRPKQPVPFTRQLNAAEIFHVILNKRGKVFSGAHSVPVEEDVDIRVIFNTGGDTLASSGCSLFTGIEAFRQVDFVCTINQYPCTNVRYSDLILPVTTAFENVGGINTAGFRDSLIVNSRVVEPLYEARSDYWIARELMKKLGMNPDELFPHSEQQEFFNVIKNTTVIEPDGKTYVPLATITKEDIAQWGVKGEPQQGKIGLQELVDKGIYQIERYIGDNYGFIAYEKFVQDPASDPLNTPSGKFEIYAEAAAKRINDIGYMKDKSPLPVYIPSKYGYEGTFKNWETKEKGEFPYQMFAIHYLGKAHTSFSNNPWLQEVWRSPIYMSAQDARENGINDGDTILVSNNYGKILRTAHVTERFMPGVMAITHGSWIDIDVETGIDIGGSNATLSGVPPTGSGIGAYNSLLVKVEKWAGKPLTPDCEKPRVVLYKGE